MYVSVCKESLSSGPAYILVAINGLYTVQYTESSVDYWLGNQFGCGQVSRRINVTDKPIGRAEGRILK